MITTAYVKIWNHRVGAIAWDNETGVGSFEFESSFFKNNWDLAPLKMPLAEAKGRIFSFSDLKDSSTFKGLPGLIADVLPDKYGNALIDAWLVRMDRPSGSMTPIETLCFSRTVIQTYG
jgi:serine/threonine-protein kinase HipA